MVGCKDSVKKNFSEEKILEVKNNKSCFSKTEREKVLKSVLSSKSFQKFLHPEAINRLPIRIIKNDFITSDLRLESNGYNVILVDSSNLGDDLAHRIKFYKIDCNEKKLNYSVFYPIEAASISGEVYKSNSLWLNSVTSVGEID
jgi:hypothetical protein